MGHKSAAIALAIVAVAPHCAAAQSQVCEEPDALVLSEAYYLAMPLWEIPGIEPPETLGDLISHVGPDRFGPEGGVVRCAQALGQYLVLQGFSAYDPQAYDRAMSVAPAGAEVLAPEVAQSINSGSVELAAMGMELQWLAQILPSAARGDFSAYWQTATPIRQTFREMLPQLALLLSMNPDIAELLRSMMASNGGAFSQLAKEQVLMMARIYRGSVR